MPPPPQPYSYRHGPIMLPLRQARRTAAAAAVTETAEEDHTFVRS